MNIRDFNEGLDPSVMPEVSGSQLLQLVREAEPSDDRGLLIQGLPTRAFIVANPKVKRYAAINDGVLHLFDQAKFDSLTEPCWTPAQVGQIGNNNITDLNWEKLTIDDILVANKILRVNATGDGFDLVDLVPDNNSITLSHLNVVEGNANKVIAFNPTGSGYQFRALEDLLTYIPAKSIGFTKLQVPTNAGTQSLFLSLPPGGENYVLVTLSGGHLTEQSVSLGKIAPGLANQQIRTKSDGLSIEWFTPQLPKVAVSGLFELNNGEFIVSTFNHELGAIPDTVSVHLVCQSSELGYLEGEEVPFEIAIQDNITPFSIQVSGVYVKVGFNSTAGNVALRRGDTGVTANLDLSKWNFKIKAIKL